MCYDISYRITLETLEDYFGSIIITDPQLEIDFEAGSHVIAHSFNKQRVVIQTEKGYKGVRSEWGLISNSMSTIDQIKKIRHMMLNARSEKIIGDKQSAWHRVRHQRCLIPVRGIFEHREVKGWKHKIPYHIYMKDRDMFCLPGLWNYSPIPDVETGEVKMTHTLITRSANELMKQIHNGGENAFRMPLFLTKELEMKWLDASLSDEGIQEILDFSFPSEELDACAVYSIRTTKPHPLGGAKTDAYDWVGLPALGVDDVQGSLF